MQLQARSQAPILLSSPPGGGGGKQEGTLGNEVNVAEAVSDV